MEYGGGHGSEEVGEAEVVAMAVVVALYPFFLSIYVVIVGVDEWNGIA